MVVERFITGMARVCWYILSTPRLLVILALMLLLLLISLLLPSAIYIYPFWEGITESIEVRPFGEQIEDVDVVVVTPNHIIPGRDYVLRVEASNAGEGNVHVTMSVSENQPYVDFTGSDARPTTWEWDIPPGMTVIKRLPFEVVSGTSPREPVTFTIGMQLDGYSNEKSLDVPVNYISVPMVAVIGVFAPILVAGVRLLLKLVFRA